MIEITDKSKCNGCHACKQICSKHAIDMVEDDEGFLYPNIEYEKCIDCGLCEKICPEINKSRVSQNVQFYAAYRNDLTRRIKSASGGIFALIAEFITKTSQFSNKPLQSIIPYHCSLKAVVGTTTTTCISGYFFRTVFIQFNPTLVFPNPVEATIVPLHLFLIHRTLHCSCRSSLVIVLNKSSCIVYEYIR